MTGCSPTGAQEATFLELRRQTIVAFSIKVAIPKHRIENLENSTGSNIWLMCIEQQWYEANMTDSSFRLTLFCVTLLYLLNNDPWRCREIKASHRVHEEPLHLARAKHNGAILWKYWLRFANNGDNAVDFAAVATLEKKSFFSSTSCMPHGVVFRSSWIPPTMNILYGICCKNTRGKILEVLLKITISE